MCGIGGIRRMGDKPIFEWEINMLLTSLEYRGNDATGIALQEKSGKIHVYKNNVQAWKFCKEEPYTKFLEKHLSDEVETVLVHTRKYTKGSPLKNENNHPIYNGKAAVVHNGFVNNDDALFAEFKWKRGCETDSDALRAIVDEHGITKKVIGKLNKIAGTVAAAAVHPEFPGKILLLRSGNPLVMGCTRDKVFFASDKRSIFRVTKPWVRRFNMLFQVPASEVGFVEMYNNSGWILGSRGLEFHDKFEATGNEGKGNLIYQIYRGDYKERQAKIERDYKAECERNQRIVNPSHPALVSVETHEKDFASPRFVYCPGPECFGPDGKTKTCMELKEEDRKTPLYMFQCKKCKTNLGLAAGAQSQRLPN